MNDDSASTRLCELCAGLDLRKLLHAKERPRAVREAAYDAWKQNRLAAQDVGEDPGDWPGERYFHRGDDAFYEHLPNMRALVASAESCDLCQAVLTSAQDRESAYPEWPIYFTVGPNVDVRLASMIKVMQQGPEDSRGYGLLAEFMICRSDNGLTYADKDFLAYHFISIAERLGLARSWVATCQAHHEVCVPQQRLDRRRPSRLLEVAEDCIRLVHDGSLNAPYATLSYCWGGPQSLTLRNDTESWLSQGFAEDELPMTFRDAIRCVRDLGIAYLWIDALCIRQDDALDQDTEICKMGDIYIGSQITIEASGASAVYESFLETNARPEPGVLVKWQDFPVLLYVRLTQPVSTWEHLFISALHQRAWTLQERILAPRTLSFGTAHVSFECSSGIIDDVYRKTHSFGEWHGLSKSAVVESRRNARDRDVEALIQSWRSIVQNYSTRKMTDASDRLPAIGGLAKRLHSAIGGSYVAGLWDSPGSLDGNLAYELCWHSVNHSALSETVHDSTSEESRAHAPEYCAPSWSWASTTGGVRPYDSFGLSTTLADIQAVKIISASGDAFGRLSYGHIDMSAASISIPDPALQPEPDHPAHDILQDLRRDCDSGEYYQHHIAHDGQDFAVLQLLVTSKLMNENEDDVLHCMVIESCGDGTWRRLFLHQFPQWTEDEVERNYRDPEPSLLKQALKRGPWQIRSFRLV